MIASLIAGTLAGSLHVLAGPDHLAAMAPVAARRGSRAGWQGLQWGLGHVLGVGVLAALALLLRDALPLDRISGISEQVVGVALVVLGLWALRRALRDRIHVHVHEHDTQRHAHVHAHRHGHAPGDDSSHVHRHASWGMGLLHGFAGTAHFVALFPALALPTWMEAVAYLLGYALGTLAAMTGVTGLLGWTVTRVGSRSTAALRGLLVTTSLVAVAVGVVWLVPS